MFELLKHATTRSVLALALALALKNCDQFSSHFVSCFVFMCTYVWVIWCSFQKGGSTL